MADPTFLRTFLAIYRSGSVTQAAKSLHLTQPAISQHLKALEVQVGRPLFVRHSRGVRATPAAHDLAQSIAPHVDALDAVLESMRTGPEVPAGPVHLGGPVDFLATRIVPALAPLVEKGVRLLVRPGLASELLDMLAAGELDLLLAMAKAPLADVTFEPFFDEELVLVMPADDPRVGPDADPDTLAAGPFVTFSHDMPVVRRYFREAYGLEVRRNPAVVVPDLRAVGAAVAAGAGLAVLPKHLVDAMGDKLLVLPPPVAVKPESVFLAYRSGKIRSPRVAAVRTLLTETAATWNRAF
ncbi:MAG TPA: LysR family transcriptional regulator [Polyangiaceae bacterium]